MGSAIVPFCGLCYLGPYKVLPTRNYIMEPMGRIQAGSSLQELRIRLGTQTDPVLAHPLASHGPSTLNP